MIDIKDTIAAIEKGAYDMEAWDFNGQEPSDAQSWCENWFNKQSLKYKLESVSLDMDDYIDDIDELKWVVNFNDALNAYWDKKGYSIDSAYYAVTLNV